MKIAVLGAGLQGCCAALELASRGVHVDLYEQNDHCLSQASGHNEGKIHLGYVYANDSSRNTARTMIRGAVRFGGLLRRFLREATNTIPLSNPFYYVVHRDSILTPAEVELHFQECVAIAKEESRGLEMDYFGSDYLQAPHRLSDEECYQLFDPQTVLAAYRTSEVSLDPEKLAKLIHSRVLADPLIQCHFLTKVKSAADRGDSASVQLEHDGVLRTETYHHVVNALWAGRLAIDRTAGIEYRRSWLYRVKYYLRMQNAGISIPSTTIVLGAFGDVVEYSDGGLYLSWYPTGMTGTSSEIHPPDWPNKMSHGLDAEIAASYASDLGKIIPSLQQLPMESIKAAQLKGGIIFAWGASDIDDPHSGLHERHEIGPVSHGRYHSVDTGKLTVVYQEVVRRKRES